MNNSVGDNSAHGNRYWAWCQICGKERRIEPSTGVMSPHRRWTPPIEVRAMNYSDDLFDLTFGLMLGCDGTGMRPQFYPADALV